MNEAGMALLDAGRVECRTIRRVDVTAVDQDVTVLDQFRQKRRGARVIGIERDAGFVEIEKCKPGAVPFRRQRRGAAKRIALWWFDLLNGRAEIGEQPAALARAGGAPDPDTPAVRQRAPPATPS